MGVAGVPLGFLEMVSPFGSSALSFLLPEIVFPRSDHVRSFSESYISV